jgi:hypothetical protein
MTLPPDLCPVGTVPDRRQVGENRAGKSREDALRPVSALPATVARPQGVRRGGEILCWIVSSSGAGPRA